MHAIACPRVLLRTGAPTPSARSLEPAFGTGRLVAAARGPRSATFAATVRTAGRTIAASAVLGPATRWTTASTAWRAAGRATARIARWRSARRPASRIARRRSTRWPASRMSRRRSARWPASRTALRRPPARRRMPGPRSRRRRRRMVRPARLLVVPGAAAIIVAPVIGEREREDRQTDRRPIVQRHIAALILRTQARRVYPAAQVRRGDVAPLEVAEAAHHRHRHAGRQLRDDRIIGRGARAHVDPARRISLRLGARQAGQRQ